MSEKTIVAMWSGPRNISTAMMRAFENRADTAVWDEPFYARYLAATGLDHPMRAEVIEAGETDDRKVIDLCRTMPTTPNRHGNVPDLWFQKHMTVHMTQDVPLDWIAQARNFFLIRRPEAVLASYNDRRADPTMEDVGFARQAELFGLATRLQGRPPPVIDSEAVLEAPERTLRALCEALSISFDPSMLAWPAGARADDGVWATHWYGSVETSTCFSRARPPRPLPDRLASLADACRPHYESLAIHALN